MELVEMEILVNFIDDEVNAIYRINDNKVIRVNEELANKYEKAGVAKRKMNIKKKAAKEI